MSLQNVGVELLTLIAGLGVSGGALTLGHARRAERCCSRSLHGDPLDQSIKPNPDGVCWSTRFIPPDSIAPLRDTLL
jgi:hypothetical protein